MKSRQIGYSEHVPSSGHVWKRLVLPTFAIALVWSNLCSKTQAEVHWRTPDRFVVPAAASEQEPTRDTPADEPQAAKLSATPRPTPPSAARAAAVPPAIADDVGAEADDGPDADCPCDRRDECGPPVCWHPFANRVEARVEWLSWWGKGNQVPPLVTTAPSNTARNEAGVLGAPGTSILFGDDGLNEGVSNGARFALDYWLSGDHALGLEFQYFFLGQNRNGFQADNNTYPVLARPFFNTDTSAQDAALIAYPGAQTGNVDIAATSSLQGADVLLRKAWYRCGGARLDFLAGYRYARLCDDLRIDEFETFIDPAGTVPVGSTLALSDRFSTVNEFQGAELGVASDWHCGRLNLGLVLKVGLGNTNSRVSISGNTTATQPTLAPENSSGGLLAQASNIGQYEQNRFTMLPELGVNLGFDLTRRLRLIGGYSLLYWGGVARSGDQIDLNLVPSEFPPPQNTAAGRFPQFRFAATDYWAQGLSLGLDYRF